jgi:hypothetical protein
VLHSKTKHIELRYHFLRDNVEKGKIDLIHVPTHDQLANIFTKPLDQATFTRLRGELGVFDFLSWCMGAPLQHMYSFPLCISCIWHGICNIMYMHLCILGCMHYIYIIYIYYIYTCIYYEAKMKHGAFYTANAHISWLRPITTSRPDQLQLYHCTNCKSTENHFVQQMYKLS